MNNKKINWKLILSWILVIMWAGVIFYLSSKTAAESTVQSREVIGSFTRILGTVITDEALLTDIDGIVRETAHGIEYLILSVLLFTALYQTFKHKGSKRNLIKDGALYTVTVAFLYALSDEIHQIPIPGRTFQLLDLAIDFTGIAVGTAITAYVIKIIASKKKSDE